MKGKSEGKKETVKGRRKSEAYVCRRKPVAANPLPEDRSPQLGKLPTFVSMGRAQEWCGCFH